MKITLVNLVAVCYVIVSKMARILNLLRNERHDLGHLVSRQIFDFWQITSKLLFKTANVKIYVKTSTFRKIIKIEIVQFVNVTYNTDPFNLWAYDHVSFFRMNE